MEQQEPSLNIPQEQQPNQSNGEAVASVEFIPAASPETAPSSERPSSTGGDNTQQMQQTQQPQAQPAGGPNSGPSQNDTSDTNPVIADDVDVLEKEWVDKAKNIVESTKHDPHMQKEEVSKLKADYMKKRYGKDIKVIND